MRALDVVRVDAHYTRAVNLERDAGADGSLLRYLPTSRALHTLGRIAATFDERPTPRSWALVGPYGSGKSAFAVFLANLLGSPGLGATKAGHRLLRDADPSLAKRVAAHTRGTEGYCRVLLTGSPEPLSQRLVQALAGGALAFWAGRRGRPPRIVGDLQAAATSGHPVPASELAGLIAALQDSVVRSGGRGVLIVIDELGKFLEYEARHFGANDIYLLQTVAEQAYAGADGSLHLVVLLHQAFERYARGLGEALRNEWLKVQGRFETIPYLDSSEQTLGIVAAALSHHLPADAQAEIQETATAAARHLQEVGALPSSLNPDVAPELFARCYPLHPVTALLLPVLCQRVAQNERTLFSYLGSQEPHGLQHVLRELDVPAGRVLPWQLYDYFIENQPAVVADPTTHRRWAEVVTALERLSDAPAGEIELLKTIGLLNIVGAQSGLKASREVLALCVGSTEAADEVVASLVQKSAVHYRRYSGEYRVWQGTDFDLEAAVAEAADQIGNFGLAESINAHRAFQPVVARRYSIESGSLRYFQPFVADAGSCRTLEASADSSRLIYFIAESDADVRLFHATVLPAIRDADVAVLCRNGARLREAVRDVLALERVQSSRQELSADPVAQRELRDRLAAAQAAEEDLLQGIATAPEASEWYWRGKPRRVVTRRQLQEFLSAVMEAIYHAAPIIKNELINRDKPSSQAHAARNKLLAALLTHRSDPDLGIDKFPPEKALYRALLLETGLHRRVGDEWQVVGPDARRDPCNIAPLWGRLEAFLAESEAEPLPFTALDPILIRPPYGVRAGVLPILYVVAYLTCEHELALYEDRRYIPYLTVEHLERFCRRPQDFAVQRFRIEGIRSSLFREYAQVISGDTGRRVTVLSLAKPLVRFYSDLPDCAKTTKDISESAQRVRAALQLAKSPERLLFELLPEALGYSPAEARGQGEAAIEGFSDALRSALRELKEVLPALVAEQQRLLCDAFSIDPKTPLPELRTTLAGRCAGLEDLTIDTEGLKAFLRRLADPRDSDESWLRGLLLFLARKPVDKWSDMDRTSAELRLAEFARRITDLRKLQVHYEGLGQEGMGDFEVILLRAVRKGASDRDEVVLLDGKTRKAIEGTVSRLTELLGDVGDERLAMAALAAFTDAYLTAHRTAPIDKAVRSSLRKEHGN